MGIKISNTRFIVRNAKVKTGSISLALGQVFRIVNNGGTNESLTYTRINGYPTTTDTITSGSITYVLAVANSLSDSTYTINGTTNLTITNLLITSSVEETPTFTEQLITTTGAGSWTKPLGVTQVIVECWGGGGAGGGATTDNQAGSGGAGGGFARKLITYGSPSENISYSVAPSVAGTTGNGATGNDTTWQTNVVVAKGGGGGSANSLNTGPAGIASTANVGDVVYNGQDGGFANTSRGGDQAGSGGPSAGSAGIFSFANNDVREFGGTTVVGPGGGNPQGNGVPGNNFGGGGSGGYRTSTPSKSGGAGAQGLIRIIYKTNPTMGMVLNLNAEDASSYPGTGTNWFDTSGNGYNATMTGSVSFVNTSPKYFNYTDTPNYFIGNSNITASISDQITIISWIKVTDTTKRSVIFDKYQTPGSPNGYIFEAGTVSGLWTNTIRFFAVGSTGDGWDPRGVTNAIQQNVPCMVSVTLDRTLLQSRLYVNGSSISYTEGGGPIQNLAANWSQGANNYTIGSYRPDAAVDSSMQQYRLTVYNRLLSASEIAAIYNSQKSLYGL